MSFRNHSLWLMLVMLLLLKALIQFMNMLCLFNDKYVFWKEKFSLVFFFFYWNCEQKFFDRIWMGLLTQAVWIAHAINGRYDVRCEPCLSVGPHNIVQLVPSPHQYSPSGCRKIKINNTKCVSVCICVYLANKFFSVSCSFIPAAWGRAHSRWILTELKNF